MPIVVRRDGAVGMITLNKPNAGNCLSMAVWAAFTETLREMEADPAIRSVLINAEGRHFCTGADLAEFKRVRADPADLNRFSEAGHRALLAIETSPLPVVAAVQGLCLAGGLELTLACDIVFAGSGARFGDQHAQFGLVPGWGGSQRLTRAIGLRRATDLLLSARWIDADIAERWGLVNTVVPDTKLLTEALAYCRMLGKRSRGGLAVMKRLAREGMDGPLSAGLALERQAVPAALMAADATEGLAAFEGKRTPDFG